MEDEQYKEVHYHAYCNTCKYREVKDTDEPCNECLSEPVNLYSHKPIKWTEDKTKTK